MKQCEGASLLEERASYLECNVSLVVMFGDRWVKLVINVFPQLLINNSH
jgi:hypothetical protein